MVGWVVGTWGRSQKSSFLLHGIFNRARNHIFLLQGTLNRVRIMLSIYCLPWLFHPPGTISFLSIAPSSGWFLLASLLLFHPSGIVSFPYSMSSTGPLVCWVLLASFWLFHPTEIIYIYPQWHLKLSKDHVWCHWCCSDYPSNRNNFFTVPTKWPQ